MQRLLNQKEAAKYCGMSVETFKSRCDVLPIAFTSSYWRYDKNKLDKWIDGLQYQPSPSSQPQTADQFLAKMGL